MRFLGIDYGRKRVGLAISDEMGRLAFPLKILRNSPDLLDLIHNLCGEENISEIVLGQSLDFSGQPNAIMAQIEEFKEEISKLGLPVHFEKEFLTSVEARREVRKEKNTARKIKRPKRKEVYASAAALILQRYLDRKKTLKKVLLKV